ncbi:MAG TPA: type 4a pilus biogenesis protein PilO [Patescibacteria group bacterium]|nr:type 4a pilus biogenesis protein PilO [Patescibacteria group bacterium]
MRIKILHKLSIAQKLIYFFLLVIVIIAALGLFVVKPAADDMQRIREDIKKQRAELEKKYLEGLNAKLISRKSEEINKNLEVLNRLFIEKDGYLDLVTSIERLAGRNDLREELNILDSNARDKKTYEVVPVHVEVKGEFPNILSFISDLKEEPYQFNINSLKIRSENPDPIVALRQRVPREVEKKISTTTQVIEMEGRGTTTTTTKEEIFIQKTSTSTTPAKTISTLILGEVYWEK